MEIQKLAYLENKKSFFKIIVWGLSFGEKMINSKHKLSSFHIACSTLSRSHLVGIVTVWKVPSIVHNLQPPSKKMLQWCSKCSKMLHLFALGRNFSQNWPVSVSSINQHNIICYMIHSFSQLEYCWCFLHPHESRI